jgi:DNA-binding transcriptional LysR family regulator
MLSAAMFDWNDLRHFLAVAREGSTHAAAKALDVSQPTVQRRLAALEESVGRKLVERHPTGYRLTELGKALLPHAEDVERSVEAFQRQLMAEGEELTGTLRVTCPEGMASRLLAPVIETFREKYPELRVDLIMTDHRLDLAKGEAEVALRMHEPGDDSLIARRIANSPWAVFASQSYIKRHGRPQRWEDLDQHAIIEFAGELADNHAARWLRSVAPRATIAIRGNSMLGVLAAVKSGAGLAPLPMLLGRSEDGLEPVLESIPEIDSKLYLVMHADLKSTPRVRAFCDFVVAEFARLRPLIAGTAKQLATPPAEEL